MNRTLPGLSLAALLAVGVPTTSAQPRVVDAQWGPRLRRGKRAGRDPHETLHASD